MGDEKGINKEIFCLLKNLLTDFLFTSFVEGSYLHFGRVALKLMKSKPKCNQETT